MKPLTLTPDIYWYSFSSLVRRLRSMPDSDRLSYAQELARQGFIIDVPIMVWGWHPIITMTVRKDMGYTWVPSALQPPIHVVPGIDFPGLPHYDPANPPPGSIKVSIDPDDYPRAKDLLISVAPFKWRYSAAHGADPDGVGSLWNPLPEDTSEVGSVFPPTPDVVLIPGVPGQYEKKSVRKAFGEQVLWERIS